MIDVETTVRAEVSRGLNDERRYHSREVTEAIDAMPQSKLLSMISRATAELIRSETSKR